MKVRRLMVTYIHINNYPVETAYLWHINIFLLVQRRKDTHFSLSLQIFPSLFD